jgi:hypothetical protein
MKKTFVYLVILALTFLTIAAVMIATGHASTTKARPNTLGVAQFYNNPYTYLLGLPMDGQVLEEKYTNIRFAPYAAADFYDVSILFCGDVTEAFKGKQGVVVIAYRAQASRAYKGIPCHALISVFEVPIK